MRNYFALLLAIITGYLVFHGLNGTATILGEAVKAFRQAAGL